jgi:hypothetical protein
MTDIINMAQLSPTVTGQANGIYTPIAARRPSDNVFIAQEIVEGFTSYLFGHRKFPKLSTDDETTTQYMEDLKKISNLESELKVARNIAGAEGTSVLVLNFSDKPIIDAYEGRFCTPLWANKRQSELAALDIMYEIKKEIVQNEKQDDINGKTIQNEYKQTVYERRLITSTYDITYRSLPNPQSLVEELIPTKWETRSIVNYNLDFVPAIWIKNYPNSDSIDGTSDYEDLLDDIDTINRIESAITNSIYINLDPTLILGISQDDLKKQGGRPVKTGSGIALVVGEKGSASYLEISGTGIELAQTRSKEKQRLAFRRAHYISLDPEKFVGENLSGTALLTLLSEMFSVLDERREIWGNVISKVLNMFIKLHKAQGSEVLKLPDVPDNLKINIQWSSFVETTAIEKKAIADTVTELLGGMPAIDRETAIEIIAKTFGLDAKIIKDRMQQQDQDQLQIGKMGGE